jgi:hypothetical protein
MTNSGSASGYKNSQAKNQPHFLTGPLMSQNGIVGQIDNNQSYNNSLVHTMGATNNTYIQNTTEENKEALKYHSISEGPKPKISRQIMAAVHQKNTQSFISSQNNQSYHEQNDYQKQQSFDKRQRSYRNEN